MQRVRLAIPAGLLFCILVGLSRTSGQGPGGSAIGFAAQIPPPPIVTPTASQQIVNDTGSIASDLYLLAGVDGNDRHVKKISDRSEEFVFIYSAGIEHLRRPGTAILIGGQLRRLVATRHIMFQTVADCKESE